MNYMKFVKSLIVFWIGFILVGNVLAQSNVGSCPAYPNVRWIDTTCGNYIKSPSELLLGQARIFQACPSVPTDFYFPQNKPTWPIAFAHSWLNFCNITKSTAISINYLTSIGIREANFRSDPTATWNNTTYPYNPFASGGCFGAGDDWIRHRDGLFQIDEATGWPIFVGSPGYFNWRFNLADHANFASGGHEVTQAHLRLMYDMVFYERNKYAVAGGTQLDNFMNNAADPYATERMFAYAWNGGIDGASGTVATMSANYAAWVADPQLDDKVPGDYEQKIAMVTHALDYNGDITLTEPGVTVKSVNHEWYDNQVKWADVTAYIDEMCTMYTEVNSTVAKNKIKPVFDAINGGNPISFRYQFSKVLDALVATFPIYDPLNTIINSNAGSDGCKLSGGIVPVITITANGPTSFCNGLDVTLTTQLGSGYNYQWYKNGTAIPSTNSNSYVAQTTGLYTVRITMANGSVAESECPVKVTVTNCSSCTMTASAIPTGNSCTGKTDGSIAVSLTNSPGGSLIYTWSGPVNGTFTTTATSYTIPNLSDGTYLIEVTRQSDPTCKAVVKATIISGIKLYQTLSIDSTRTACDKLNLLGKLTDNPPSQCQWTLRITKNAGDAFGDNLYFKLALDGAENLSLTKTEITSTATLITRNLTVSNGSAITLYFQTFASACWYWGNADKYKFELIDAKGVTVFSFIPVANGGTYLAANSQMNITSSAINANCAQTVPTYTYTWSPGTGLSSTNTLATSATIMGTTSYTLTAVPNGNPGCQLTKAISLPYKCAVTCTAPTGIPLFLSPTVSACSPATTASVIANLPSGVYYQLFNSTTNASIGTSAGPTASAGNVTINNVPAGSYHIRIASSAANLTAATCYKASTTPVIVLITTTPSLTITNPAPVCAPGTVDITAAAVTAGSTGGGTLSYWINAAGTTALTTPTAVAAGGVYYIKSTAGTCTDIKPVTVTINPAHALTITNPSGVCSPSTIDLTVASVTNGSSAGTLSYWTNAAATTALSSPNAVSTSNTYYIKLTSAAGCSDIKPVTVTINSKPTLVITNPSAVCSPSTVDLTAASVTNGSSAGVLSYWTNAAATASLSLPNTVSVSNTYYIMLASGVGCSDIQPVTVTISPAPALTITNPAAVCSPGTVDLTAASITAGSTGAGTLSYWTNSAGTTALTSPTAVATGGVYYIKSTLGTCTDIKPVTVTISPAPVLTITNPAAVCSPGTVDITAAAITAGSTGAGTLSYWTNATGTTALTTPTAVATGGVYYIKSTVGTCTDIKPVTVTISPAPGAPGVTPVAYCQNVTAVPLTATGTNLKWYTQAVGGTSTTTAPTPSTVTVGTTSYWVSATTGSCEGPRAQIDVVVSTTLASPTVTPVSFCQGSTATPLTAGGSSLLWYITSTGGTGNTTAPTPSTGTIGTTSHWVSQVSGSCESPRVELQVTITANPSAPGVSNPGAYCIGSTAAALTATGTNLKWYDAATGGTLLSGAPTPSTATAGTTTYWVSQTVSGCESPRASIDVTVNAAPVAPTTTLNPVVYCQNAAATALTANGTNLKWYSTATGTTALGTAPTPVTTAAGSPASSYWVSQTVDGCEGARLQIDVNVVSGLTAPTVSNISYCQGETPAALTAGGTGLLWYTASSGGTSSTTAPTPNTSTPGLTSYYVSQGSGSCESPRAQLDVTIKASPLAPTASNPSAYCEGATAIPLTATGTDLKWYTQATGGTGSSIIPTPVTSTAGTTSYWVSQTVAGCEGPRTQIDVQINTVPPAPGTSNPSPYCVGAVANLLTATGNNLLWYTTSTNGTGSTTAPSPSTAAEGTTSYWVSQTENGCESPRAKVDVTVNKSPDAPLTISPITYCQGDIASQLTAVGTSLLWYNDPTSGTGSAVAPIPNTSAGGTTSYYVSIALSGCESLRAKIDVLVKPNPSDNLAVNGSEACVGADATATIVASEAGVTYEAYEGATKLGTAISNGGNLTINLSTSSLSEGTYTISFKAIGCGSTDLTNTAEVLLLGKPGAITGPLNTIICNNANTGLIYSIDPVEGAASYFWSIDNGGKVNGASTATTTTPNVSVDLSSANINPTFITVYAVTANGLQSCESSKDVIKQLQGYQTEDVLLISDKICQGEELTFTVNNPNAEFYLWEVNPLATAVGTDASTEIIRRFDLPGTYTVTLQPSHPCKAPGEIAPIVKTINVAGRPIAFAGNDTIMTAYSTIELNGTGSSAGQYLWTSNAIGASIANPGSLIANADFKGLHVEFTLTVTEPDGGANCYATDTRVVELDVKVNNLPNAFSPNGDGNHDTYEIPNIKHYPEAMVYIYNQWGELIFKSEPGYTKSWDGKRNGKECEVGAYLMLIEFNQDGLPSIKETINLVR